MTALEAISIDIGDGLALELGKAFKLLNLCFRRHVDPPQALQVLQCYSELDGVGMVINGRRFLGNTSTVIAGPSTKMRFGTATMNNLTFHTFHLHSHRWTIPSPNGTTAGAIQGSIQSSADWPGELIRVLTINQGSIMGSRFTPDPSRAASLGEWHMHCHVLQHMMPGGMMGSLLVIEVGELAFTLPHGEPKDHEAPESGTPTVVVDNFAFMPANLLVPSGRSATFDFQEADHTVTMSATTGTASAIEINNGGGPADVTLVGQSHNVTVTGNSGDTITFICGFHGAGMTGTISII